MLELNQLPKVPETFVLPSELIIRSNLSYYYLVIIAGKVGFEPTSFIFQNKIFTEVTLYFTIVSKEIRKSVF